MSDRPDPEMLALMYPGGEAKSNADLMATNPITGTPLFYKRWWSEEDE